jgi:hypothetical protein
MSEVVKPKNRVVAILLSVFLGMVGADRFYLGKPKTAWLKLLTFGGLMLWWAVDAAMLGLDAFLFSFGKDTGFVKDGKGNDLDYGISMYRLKNGRLLQDWFRDRDDSRERLADASTQTTEREPDVQRTLVSKCSSCGAPIVAGQKACQYCGTLFIMPTRREPIRVSRRSDFGFRSTRVLWASLVAGIALSALGVLLNNPRDWWGNDVSIFQWLVSIPLWYLTIGLLKSRQARSLSFVPAVFLTSPLPLIIDVVAIRRGGFSDDLVGIAASIGGLAVFGYIFGLLMHLIARHRMRSTQLLTESDFESIRPLRQRHWMLAAAAYAMLVGGPSGLLWWINAPHPTEPAAATDHPYASQIRFEQRIDESSEISRWIGGVVQNRGDRHITWLDLAVNVVDADGDVRNTGRHSVFTHWFSEWSLAPGERVAVSFEVYPKREGRVDFVVEKIEVGLPMKHAMELQPLPVEAAPGAGVDNLEGVLEHHLRAAWLSQSGECGHIVFLVTNVSAYSIDNLTYRINVEDDGDWSVDAARFKDDCRPIAALEPGETRTIANRRCFRESKRDSSSMQVEVSDLTTRYRAMTE